MAKRINPLTGEEMEGEAIPVIATTLPNNDKSEEAPADGGINVPGIIMSTLVPILLIGAGVYLLEIPIVAVFLIVLVLLPVFLTTCYVGIYALAKNDMFWTYLVLDQYTFIEEGGRITDALIERTPDNDRTVKENFSLSQWAWKQIGNPTWVGLYPFKKVSKGITITVPKETGEGLMMKEIDVSHLYQISPQTYEYTGIETAGTSDDSQKTVAGGPAINATLAMEFEVKTEADAVHGVVTRNSKMYLLAILFIQEWLNDLVNNRTMTEWFGMNKSEILDSFFDIPEGKTKSPQQELYDTYKVWVRKMDLSSSDPVSKATREAMEAKNIAEMRGEADIVKANIAAKQVEIAANAEMVRLTKLGEGQRQRLKKTFPNASDEQLLELVKIEELSSNGNLVITGSGGANSLININPKGGDS